MPLSFETVRKDIVMIPAEYMEPGFTGDIYGIFHCVSGVFNVVPPQLMQHYGEEYHYLGKITNQTAQCDAENMLIGRRIGDAVVFTYNGREYAVQPYTLRHDLFSRNTGILENSEMRRKRIVSLSAGSVNSKMILEMARSGVGSFLLIDNDIVEYHTIARSEYSINDVGEYKVEALARMIRHINPEAEVITQVGIAECVRKEVWDAFMAQDSTLVFAGADNRSAHAYGNDIAMTYGVPFVSVACWERCFAGETFYWIPGMGMPCYRGAVGDDDVRNQHSGVTSASRRFYQTDPSEVRLAFQPGLSVDITSITNKGIQIAIDILNLSTPGYKFKVLEDIGPYTVWFNTKNSGLAGSQAELGEWLLKQSNDFRCSLKPINCGECAQREKCSFRQDPQCY